MTEARLEDAGNGTWKLMGDLGYATVSGLLQDTPPDFSTGNDIQLDLSGVTRADSAGLALLIEWLKASRGAGRSMTFLHIPAQMQSIARVSGLADILFGSPSAGAGGV